MISVQPDYPSFLKRTRKGERVALWTKRLADLETPVSAFIKLGGLERDGFLFESVEHGKMGRYSFMGVGPRYVLETGYPARGVVGDGRHVVPPELLFPTIRSVLSERRVNADGHLPPFVGGLVGFLGYEMVAQCESVKLRAKRRLGIPDAVLFGVEDFVIFDHLEHALMAVHVADASRNPRKAYARGRERLEVLLRTLERPVHIEHALKAREPGEIRSNMTKREFADKVRRIQEYIRAGDTIQVVLSQRFDLGKIQDEFWVYRALRSLNPSPYMFYFRCGDVRLLGSSPESLVKKTGRSVLLSPIAGTRRRGVDDAEDEVLEQELRSSEKEQAEHVMLVDLGRNDIGRVCDYRTVQVADYARIERYSHVMHLVSDVRGRMAKGHDAVDLLKATFPAGTVTGAPKVRAMQIIEELEPDMRGPYAGGMGYFSYSGDLDMCIVIRSMVVHRGHAYVQAGAGIVNDSIPEAEYEESINKARAVVYALRGESDTR